MTLLDFLTHGLVYVAGMVTGGGLVWWCIICMSPLDEGPTEHEDWNCSKRK